MKFWDDKISTEVDDFSVSWANRLANGEIITAANFSFITQAGLEIEDETYELPYSTVRLSGGTKGAVGHLMCEITTNNGRTLQQEVKLGIS